jgi:hypothetical protein
MLDERRDREWEAKKRRVFEELGGRARVAGAGGENQAYKELKKSMGPGGFGKSVLVWLFGCWPCFSWNSLSCFNKFVFYLSRVAQHQW